MLLLANSINVSRGKIVIISFFDFFPVKLTSECDFFTSTFTRIISCKYDCWSVKIFKPVLREQLRVAMMLLYYYDKNCVPRDKMKIKSIINIIPSHQSRDEDKKIALSLFSSFLQEEKIFKRHVHPFLKQFVKGHKVYKFLSSKKSSPIIILNSLS